MVRRNYPEDEFSVRYVATPSPEPSYSYVPNGGVGGTETGKLIVLGVVAICFLGLLAFLVSRK